MAHLSEEQIREQIEKANRALRNKYQDDWQRFQVSECFNGSLLDYVEWRLSAIDADSFRGNPPEFGSAHYYKELGELFALKRYLETEDTKQG
jgi:hypothetical protein